MVASLAPSFAPPTSRASARSEAAGTGRRSGRLLGQQSRAVGGPNNKVALFRAFGRGGQQRAVNLPPLAALAQPEPATDADGPTQVPRKEGIVDGEWNALDAEAVRESQLDAEITLERSLLDAAPSSSAAAGSGFHLLGLTLDELKEFAVQNGQKPFRGKQLRDHLYGSRKDEKVSTPAARDLDDFTTLPKALRASLSGLGVQVGRAEVHTVAVRAVQLDTSA